jgi:hypothetical protein
MGHGYAYTISSDKAYLARLIGNLLHKAQLFEGAWRHAWCVMAAMWLSSCVSRANPYLCIDVWAWSKPRGRCLPEQWAALSSLTMSHTINRVIACSLIYNKNLATCQVPRVGPVPTGDWVRAPHMAGVLTPEAHLEPSLKHSRAHSWWKMWTSQDACGSTTRMLVRHGYRQRYPLRDLERGCENSLVRRWGMKCG